MFSKTVLKNLFSKPATEQYPFKPREYTERTRGHVVIEIDKCVLCGLCAKRCPANAIKVDRAAGTWSIFRFGCVQCGSCAVGCPRKCLSMGAQYTEPGATKEWSVYRKETAAAQTAGKTDGGTQNA